MARNDNSAINARHLIVKILVMHELESRLGIETDIRTRLQEYQNDLSRKVIIDDEFEEEM